MNVIALRPITQANWQQVYRLTKTLTDQQRRFVADNGYSMLEALYEPESFTPYAIYADETPVGFLMIGYDREAQQYWIDRFMIGGEYQRKGYGRDAMILALDLFKAMPNCDAVYISFVPENHAARRLYERFGFLDTGQIEYGELVFRLPLTENQVS
jgi:diamine N-acetyltransferase